MTDPKYLNQLSKFQRPVPGQSLTNNPEEPYPFEQAPEYVNKRQALEEIFMNMTREEVYVPLMEALERGTTVMESTQVILFEGFRNGKWNPDLFMTLIEPTAYMTLALAERAGIEAAIDREEDLDEVEQREMSTLERQVEQAKDRVQDTPPSGALPSEIETMIREFEPESLLARRQTQDPEPQQLADVPVDENSLLAR